MRQKSLNESMTSLGKKAGMATDVFDIDDLLDDEGWDLLNSLTEEELEQLNSDFDPESSLLPIGDRDSHASKNAAPMFKKEDLVGNLEKMVAQSKPVIKNEKIRKKEEEKKKQKEAKLKRQYSRERYDPPPISNSVALTEEEEQLLNEATEEELIEAAALLKMNGILTNDQINSVFAGEKPEGSSIKTCTPVRSTRISPAKIVKPSDEETELDVVALMKNLKDDTDDLFYICVNNQPKLEKKILNAIFESIGNSKKVKHVSLSMTGIIDIDAKALAKSIRYNEQLETLNLESNIITQSGLDALMKEVARHPTLREIKISNQKQPFGGQGEAMMADAIDRNENILKFGYSFKQPGPRNKADRAIIRHNENLRQRRRNGDKDVYDLKAICKIRDPWPQPWIISKGRRLLGGLLEQKVTEMGHMIDVDNDTGGESRGPNLSQTEAKPLDINALLSARKAKLKGSKIADLEEKQERKNKIALQEMQESMKPKKEEEQPKEEIKEKEEKEPLEVEEETSNGEQEDKKEKKKGLSNGADIVKLNDDVVPKRRIKKYESIDDQGLDFGGIEETPPVQKEQMEPVKEEQKKPLVKGLKIAALQEDDSAKPIRRKKKVLDDEDDKGGLNFDDFKKTPEKTPESEQKNVLEKVVETPKEEESKKTVLGKGLKIAALQNEDHSVTRRRRKKVDEDEEEGLDFGAFEVPKTEPISEIPKEVGQPEPKKEVTKVEEKTPARVKKLSREGGAKIIADLPADDIKPMRRRRKQPSFEDEDEQKLKEVEVMTEAEKVEEESKRAQLLKNSKSIKAELDDHGVRRRKTSKEDMDDEVIDPFSNLAKKVTKLASPGEIRRRKIAEEEEEEEEIDLITALEERKKQEAKDKAEAEAKAKKEKEDEEKRKLEETRQRLADIEGRKKKLSLEGGRKVVASFEPAETVPRRRRKPKYEEEVEENDFLKTETKVEEKKEEIKEEVQEEPKIEEEPEVKLEPKKDKIEERKNKLSREGGKKIVLTPLEDAAPIRKRRSKKYDDEVPNFVKEEQSNEEKQEETNEKEEKEKEEQKAKEEEEKKRILGGKKIAELPPPSENMSIRRRKKDENEEEKIDAIAMIEKAEINAVRNAAKNIKALPPPDTGVTSIRRRRRKDDDEENIDPFAGIDEKPREKSSETRKEKSREQSPERKGDRRSNRSREISPIRASKGSRDRSPERKNRSRQISPERKTRGSRDQSPERRSRGSRNRSPEERKERRPVEKKETSKPSLSERAKKIASLPPPDEGITPIRRRRRRDEEEENVDPFANLEEKKEEPPRRSSNRPSRDDDDDSSARRIRSSKSRDDDDNGASGRIRSSGSRDDDDDSSSHRIRSSKRDDNDSSSGRVRSSGTRDEDEDTSRKSRRRHEEEDNTSSSLRERRTKVDSTNESKGKWYTDEETKAGDRRLERRKKSKDEDDTFDIFSGRNDDDGPKLSLREGLAQRRR